MANVKRIRTSISRTRGLTARPKMLFEDTYGNRLFAVGAKEDKRVQYFAKNAQGKLVNNSGVKTMMRRWNKTR